MLPDSSAAFRKLLIRFILSLESLRVLAEILLGWAFDRCSVAV